MRTITPSLPNFLYNHTQGNSIARAKSYPVKSYRALVQRTAELAYFNKDHLLFFRGQSRDFRNKANASTIYPSIYRGERISNFEIDLRFDLLTSSSEQLIDLFTKNKLTGHIHIRRRKYIQWSILQHYEVCSTPLLDLTHSLLVACSFAFNSSQTGDPYVLVFGLPYMTNRISINTEHDIVNIRLLSICPPDALRPYFQDGYLAGTDEITTQYSSKDELDFNNRLIAKFRLIRSNSFWGKGFNAIPKEVLYPKKDIVKEICDQIKSEDREQVSSGNLGLLLKKWIQLENTLLSMARQISSNVYTVREALLTLKKNEIIQSELIDRIDNIRTIRNLAVHEPSRIEIEDIRFAVRDIDEIIKKFLTSASTGREGA